MKRKFNINFKSKEEAAFVSLAAKVCKISVEEFTTRSAVLSAQALQEQLKNEAGGISKSKRPQEISGSAGNNGD